MNGGGELQEYIVVDADDVNHTTVEMYSSGIYHQVRGGLKCKAPFEIITIYDLVAFHTVS